MKRSCPLCKSVKTKLIPSKTREKIGKVVKCLKCGHIFTDFDIPQEKLEKFLNEYYEKDGQRKDYIRNKELYIQKIQKDNIRRFLISKKYLNSKQKIIDFGAGYCLFAYLIKPFVSDIYVIDKSELAKENSKKFGLKYRSDINNIKSSFDTIFAFHSIEHLINPIHTLNTFMKVLTKNGLLFIEVPNHNDLLLKVSKKYRSFYYQFAHLHYFTSKTLTRIAINAGFNIKLKIPTQRYGLSNHLKWVFKKNYNENKYLEFAYKYVISHSPSTDTLFYIFEK